MSWGAPADLRLGNGLRVVVLPARMSPLAEVRLLTPVPGRDPVGRAAADLVAHCLGGSGPWTANLDADHLLIRAGVLPGDLIPLLARLAAAVITPRHDPEAVRRAVSRRSSTATGVDGGHRALLTRTVLAGRFLNHPLAAEPPSGPDIAACTAEQVAAAHARLVVPAGSVLLVAGAVDEPSALTAITASWGGWSGSGSAGPAPLRVRETGPGVRLLPAPDDGCTTVVAAGPAPAADSPAFPAALLTATVLAGDLDARLFRALSRCAAVVLNASCIIEHCLGGSWVSLETDVLDAEVSDVVATIGECLDGLRSAPPDDSELRTARAGLFRTGIVPLATTAESATAAVRALARGLPWDHWLTMPSAAAAVTRSELSTVAGSCFAPQRLTLAASGPAVPASSERRVPL